jgi:hypothetical protein
MAYNAVLALAMLKTRLNRPSGDTVLDEHLTARLDAADKALANAGIHLLEDSSDDLMLLVDYAAWQYQNRDKPGGMPEWLRLARRERWLAERMKTDDP